MNNKIKIENEWKDFFDSIGVSYSYKKSTFNVEGGKVTPSFFLYNVGVRSGEVGTWFHVGNPGGKGLQSIKGEYYLEKFMELLHLNNMIICNDSPSELMYYYDYKVEALFDKFMIKEDNKITFGHDYPMQFFKCHDCNRIKIEYPEGSYMECPNCGGQCNPSHPDILSTLGKYYLDINPVKNNARISSNELKRIKEMSSPTLARLYTTHLELVELYGTSTGKPYEMVYLIRVNELIDTSELSESEVIEGNKELEEQGLIKVYEEHDYIRVMVASDRVSSLGRHISIEEAKEAIII